MIQVIFISVKPPGRGLTRQYRALSRALKIEKVKSPDILPPLWGGATNDWLHTLHNDSNWHIQLQRPACLEIILIYYSI